MILGITGTFAAGKDTVAEYLAFKKGFKHISTGNLLREYITEHQLGSLDRVNLQKVGNQVRTEKGAGYLVNQALRLSGVDMVISGIRNPGEVDSLRAARGVLMAVDAPVHRRFEWAKARGRIDDATTPEEFHDQEAAEESHDPNAQQLTRVIAMADFDIANDGSMFQLYEKVDLVLKHLGY